MRRTWRRRITAWLGGGLVLLALVVSTSGQDDPVKIPAIAPLSGPIAALGQDEQKAAIIAVDEINRAGGLKAFNGRKLAIEISDTQGKLDVVRSEMERLATREKAPIVLGYEISAATAVAAQFAEQQRVPFLNSAAVSEDILKRGYKWYFSEMGTSGDEAAAALAFLEALAKAAGGERPAVSFFYEDSPRGAGTAIATRKLVEHAGFRVVADVSYNRAERNLLTFVSKLQQAKPEVVFWSGYTADVVAGLKAMQQLSFTPYVIGAGGGLGDPRLTDSVDAAFLERVCASTVDYFNPDVPRAKKFTEAFRARYNRDPSPYASIGYRAVYTVRAVLERAGKLDREAIRTALQQIEIPGDATVTPYRAIKFGPDGRNVGVQNLITQWHGGRKVTVWPSELATGTAIPLRKR
jgi:branched-chain amino acid transport system substrate-binding protein